MIYACPQIEELLVSGADLVEQTEISSFDLDHPDQKSSEGSIVATLPAFAQVIYINTMALTGITESQDIFWDRFFNKIDHVDNRYQKTGLAVLNLMLKKVVCHFRAVVRPE